VQCITENIIEKTSLLHQLKLSVPVASAVSCAYWRIKNNKKGFCHKANRPRGNIIG
jgi:hypothetical protein